MLERLKPPFLAVDDFQQERLWLSFPVAVLRKASDDQAGSLAALIAYYGFLAVFPLLLVFASVLGFVLAGDPGLKNDVLRNAENSFPSLSGYITNEVSGSRLALGAGLAWALWAGLGVTRATERAMDSIWDIPLEDRPNIWWSRVRGLLMLVVLGSTFLLSTALASLRAVGGGPFGVATDVLAVGGALLLNVVLYLLAFQVLTNRRLAWRQILPGAVVGAIGWTVLQNLGTYYVDHEVTHASKLYGSLAIVVGILAWIYLGARLTLYAAEINVVLTYRLWPRSLTAGVTTEADRLAFRRQAREAQRAVGEEIDVLFATADRSDTAGPETTTSSLVAHLRVFESYRREASACADPEQLRVLEANLADEARSVVSALGELTRCDEVMAAAFEGWPTA